MQGTGGEVSKEVLDFLKTVSTATRCLEFATDEQLDDLPHGMAVHIEELEDLLSRLSLEAEAMLARVAVGGKR